MQAFPLTFTYDEISCRRKVSVDVQVISRKSTETVRLRKISSSRN